MSSVEIFNTDNFLISCHRSRQAVPEDPIITPQAPRELPGDLRNLNLTSSNLAEHTLWFQGWGPGSWKAIVRGWCLPRSPTLAEGGEGCAPPLPHTNSGAPPPLAVTVDVARLCGVCEPGALVSVETGVSVQTLGHLVTDHVHQPLEHGLEQRSKWIISLHVCSRLTYTKLLQRRDFLQSLLNLKLILNCFNPHQTCQAGVYSMTASPARWCSPWPTSRRTPARGCPPAACRARMISPACHSLSTSSGNNHFSEYLQYLFFMLSSTYICLQFVTVCLCGFITQDKQTVKSHMCVE